MTGPAPESKRVLSRKEPKPERMGSYQILSRLAEGGMGTVYYARHAILGGVAAVKVIKTQRGQSAKLVKRFQAEAQALARVQHKNVVQVLDVGEDRGKVFIAMELAAGMDLKRWLKRDGPLDGATFAFVARQMIAGIAAAHEAGVLHRDIKPDNVIVDQLGGVKVTDFGLADDARLQAGGKEKQTFATVAYAAPEVLRGAHSDSRSDVFSLAATLWHVALGELPFGKGKRAEVMAAQQQGLPKSREALKGLPATLANAILAGLSLNPDERPEDAGAFLDAAFPHQSRGLRPRHWVAAAALVLAIGCGIGLLNADTGTQEEIRAQVGDPANADEKSENDAPAEDPESDNRRSDSTHRATITTTQVSPAREQIATREWQTLQELLTSFDTPMQLGALTRFSAAHSGTRAAKEAEDRFTGLAAVFERQRREAFDKLQQDLKRTQDPIAKSALLAAFPQHFAVPIEGTSNEIIRELKAIRTATEKAQRESRSRALVNARNAITAGNYLPARVLLSDYHSHPDARVLLTTIDQHLRDAHQQALVADDAYFERLRQERQALIATLRKRIAKESAQVWAKGPRSDDHREAEALIAIGQRLGQRIRAAWRADLAERDLAYAWFEGALAKLKDTVIVRALKADEAPRVGVSPGQEQFKAGTAAKGLLTLTPTGKGPTIQVALRDLGVVHWLRLAKLDPEAGLPALLIRISQVADQGVRRLWFRSLRRSFPDARPYEGLHFTAQVLNTMESESRKELATKWRGTCARYAGRDISEAPIRGFVLDATQGTLRWDFVKRAWRLAPESYRVARALAALALEASIPEAELLAVQEFLRAQAKSWQDETLWRWERQHSE